MLIANQSRLRFATTERVSVVASNNSLKTMHSKALELRPTGFL